MPEQPKPYAPLTGNDAPALLRDVDTSWLLSKVENGDNLTDFQRSVLIEDTRYRVSKKLTVNRTGAAFTLKELRKPPVADSPKQQGATEVLLDDAALLAKLEAVSELQEIVEKIGVPRNRKLRPAPGETGDQPKMSVQQCVSHISQALRQGNCDFAVTHAEEALQLYDKTPQITYIAALAYAYSAAKNTGAESIDRIVDHKRAIELFDRCLQQTEGTPGYADVEANARKKRLEVLPMGEQLDALRKKREEGKK